MTLSNPAHDATGRPPEEVSVHRVTDVTWLQIRGELDLRLATRALPSVNTIVRAAETTPVLADLSSVTFIDLIGVALLVKLLRGLELQGRRLAIVIAGRQPERILELRSLALTLPLHRTIESGLQALATEPPVPPAAVTPPTP